MAEPVHVPSKFPRVGWTVAAVGCALGLWGLWRVLAPPPADARAQLARAREDVATQAQALEELRQRVATLTRSDQISRDANRELQRTLAERDEELAGLRADVAFYERLVGATAQRRGLNVHGLHMQAQAAGVWHFTGTLTQNLNRDAVSPGSMSLVIEGSRGGRLQRLDWPSLRQQPNAPGVPYSFKYFQQVEGDVFLPPGLVPARVTVRLAPKGGAVVEQSFTWLEATRDSP